MSPDPAAGPAIYEFTVAGSLGPVLRCALRPHQGYAQTCTILRARTSADKDLVDLVMLLQAKGLRFDRLLRLDSKRLA